MAMGTLGMHAPPESPRAVLPTSFASVPIDASPELKPKIKIVANMSDSGSSCCNVLRPRVAIEPTPCSGATDG